jgi:phosphoglycerate dehydrogenase-like enzyme
MLKVAILDDYAAVALECADWSRLDGIASIDVFHDHLSEAEAIRALQEYDVLCTMRERMVLTPGLFKGLPRLKLVTIVGAMLPGLDVEAASRCGVLLVSNGFNSPSFAGAEYSTPELTWALVLASVRNLAAEERRMRQGLWQGSVGAVLGGRTLGLIGLGNVGKRVARYGVAFDMEVIAWSQNLTAETAAGAGARRVKKEELFARSDILSIHVRLSERSRGLVGASELALMKPTAHLVNTSRGPIVDEAALIAALDSGRLAGAALDTFDIEPLPADHVLRKMDKVTLTPHLGYASRELLRSFYGDMPVAIEAFARGAPIRVINPQPS